MEKYINILIVLLVLNTIFSLLVFFFNFRRNRTKGVLLMVIIFFVPVISECYFLMVLFFKLVLKLFRVDEVDVTDLAAKEKIQVIEAANIELDRNKVPLEESLIISDKSDRRNAFLEMLKTDIMDSIDIIRAAVEDKDSEISHYAAAFLLEEIAKFKRREKELSDICEEKNNISSIYSYLNYTGEFLEKNIMMIEEQRRYSLFYDNKLQKLIEMSGKTLEGKYIAQAVKIFGTVDNNQYSKKWVDYSMENSRNDLEAVKICLKYYYSKGQFINFKALMEDVKNSSMLLDNEMVEWVRFFS